MDIYTRSRRRALTSGMPSDAMHLASRSSPSKTMAACIAFKELNRPGRRGRPDALLALVSGWEPGSSDATSAAYTASTFSSKNWIHRSNNQYTIESISTLSPQSRVVSSPTSTTARMLSSLSSPPVIRREEDRVVYAGAAPEGWKLSVPRQSQGSTESLLDPPVPIPDPYGWMRDDKREDAEVLEHLRLENK